MAARAPNAPKRLIVCCDGTWMDSLGKKGYVGQEPPSNVTRISRVLCRTCADGTHQIINYFPGVGTANALDQFTGGAFGMGLDRDIREVYNFICTNHVDDDDIILVGFSRGAFTARSTADLIASIGLLTPEGLDHFYAIFDDYENMGNTSRSLDDYLVSGLARYNNSHGQAKIEWEDTRMRAYKQGLKDLKYARDTHHDGVTEIKIKALAVWDTVGSLGIPPAPIIGTYVKLTGVFDYTWTFTNTQISNKVENAFQALALDEPRYAFRPSLWERLPGSPTNLKQCWFPGTHANIGGGWYDQQMACITLAWMCDQLSTLGVEFNATRMGNMFRDSLHFSATHPFPFAPRNRLTNVLIPKTVSNLFRRRPSSSSSSSSGGNERSTSPRRWAVDHIFRPPPSKISLKRDGAECSGRDTHPEHPTDCARAWGLGMLRSPTSAVQTLAGKTVRRPGLFMRVDEDTNEDTSEPLLNTAETIHSSARVRLACQGLGLDDKDVWACDALLKGDEKKGGGKPLWRLERKAGGGGLGSGVKRFQPRELSMPGGEYPESVLYPVKEDDNAWEWVYAGSPPAAAAGVPQATVLSEEPLVGYWERYLLALLAGEADVWRFAQLWKPE
ncbi:hypothetical protein B0H63DRAFT_437430 [Podospora didyma]|uniref:T6SS Phospholipase effector Tle1-like catalytic domain-containing protein n=1 Tax=Podospora didyma TaxID=330526 RepID=A0AAE0KEC8_9PEZI|nr:hypothetical protein B0H63DRAFT_437430 [Podospora didyma]